MFIKTFQLAWMQLKLGQSQPVAFSFIFLPVFYLFNGSKPLESTGFYFDKQPHLFKTLLSPKLNPCVSFWTLELEICLLNLYVSVYEISDENIPPQNLIFLSYVTTEISLGNNQHCLICLKFGRHHEVPAKFQTNQTNAALNLTTNHSKIP